MGTPKRLIEKYSDLKKYPNKTSIDRPRQPYVDEPVYFELKLKKIAESLAEAFKNKSLKPIQILTEYRRHVLRWDK